MDRIHEGRLKFANFKLRVLFYHIVLHLVSQVKHIVIWYYSLLLDVGHDYPRQVEVFEGLGQLVEVKVG